MTRIPQRLSLVAQTASILREAIQSAVWSKWLPGEHYLCMHLQVSRVTLRAALAQLEREGLVRGGQGRRREVVSNGRAAGQPPSSTTVILLTPVPLEALQRFALYWTDDLREHLGKAGYQLEVHESRACYSAHPEPALEMLALRFRPAGWVLYQSSVQMQRWFSDRALPCVITGSRHPDVQLPCVDIDYRAACRHAAGLFLARGHRHLAFLNVSSGLAGDRESEEGFRDAIRTLTDPRADVLIANHDATVEDIGRHLDAWLALPARPTALLVSKAYHVLTALGHLTRRGIRIPQDASLISRDDESFLQHVLPTVARYSADPAAMARRISRLVLEMVRDGAIRPRECRLMPEFVPGESLAACPGLDRPVSTKDK